MRYWTWRKGENNSEADYFRAFWVFLQGMRGFAEDDCEVVKPGRWPRAGLERLTKTFDIPTTDEHTGKQK
jgi:hypothetical protein